MATLSERIINGSNDVVEQIVNSDYVQKILLTGEQNKTLFQRVLRYYQAQNKSFQSNYAKVGGIPNLKPNEKEMFEKMSTKYPEGQAKYIEEFAAALGGQLTDPIPAEVSARLDEQSKKFEELIASGNVPKIITVLIPGFAVPLAVQNYLVANNYKANTLTDLVIQKNQPLDRIVGGFKSLLDGRAGEVTPDVEAELTGLYRRVTENSLNGIKRLSS